MLEIQKNIFGFIKSSNANVKTDSLSFKYDEPLKKYLEKEGINFEQIRDQEIIITFSDLNFFVYEKVDDFLKLSNLNKNNVLIINYEGNAISKVDDVSYIDFKSKQDFYFFSNALAYDNFMSFLKGLYNDDEEVFQFIDYVNDASLKIVFTSLADRSRLIINYKKVPLFDADIDYSYGLVQFKECFANQDQNLQKFLKSSLIKYCSRYDKEDRNKLLFQNLNSIIEDAKMTFEIYINNLSIDKIKKDYDEYKSKYFNEASDILKKITQQIIGFPIVISSTLFAIEKVKDNDIFLGIASIVIFITTFYLILLLSMNFKDLNYIKVFVIRDFNSLKGNAFFGEFPEQLKTFEDIRKRIIQRIDKLILICDIYYWVLNLSNTAIICMILYYLKFKTVGILFFALFILFVLILSKNNTWQNEMEN